MSYKIEPSGNITMYQGDSIEITINGLPTDSEDYRVYFAAQNEEREPAAEQVDFPTNGESSVVIKLNGNYTNAFTVDPDKKSQKYYYGVKLCSAANNTEDTLLLGDNQIGGLNTITVYPRKVEGM